MKTLKFEIILVYYKRPKVVFNALESIKQLKYDNWHLTFIDDSGDDSFRENLFSFGIDKEKISYIPIMMPDNEKVKLGGSIFGKYMNDCLNTTDSDILIVLCDDDALLPDYLNNLNNFYSDENMNWGYCHVLFFDPYEDNFTQAKPVPKNPEIGWWRLNIPCCPASPTNRLDSSQITFRISAMKNKNVLFPYPKTVNLDSVIFQDMYSKYGECKFTSCVGQYKGWSSKQLGVRDRITKDIYTDKL